MHDCTQKHRIERIESDIKELQKTDRKHTEDISGLKEGQAESRIFQKLILDQLAEIKMMITTKKEREHEKPQSFNKEWMDLLKWVLGGTIIAIVTWMVSSQFIGG